MDVRYALKKDVDNILSLEREWLQEGISNIELSNEEEIGTAIKESRILVVENDLKIIAYLLWRFHDEKNCDLDSIYTLPEYRNQKIADKLMKKFLTLPKIVNCKSIYLTADSTQEEKLIRFYKRYDFNKIAVKMKRIQ